MPKPTPTSPPQKAFSFAIALALMLIIAGCGFRPLYQKGPDGESVTEDMAQTRIMNVVALNQRDARLGQRMRNLLVDRLNPDGRPEEPRYSLDSQIATRVEETGLQITEEATRARLTVTASFVLRDAKTGGIVFRGSETSVNSYNIAASEYATLTAQGAAADQSAREIADLIKLRLGMYFAGVRTAQTAP